ncbi:FxsA family protein [Falsibacillus albus]|uniref:Membrane protein FxsA n=1 Tax=Falsibacillus albus TaxID=2478915 RepID=A0A3L7KBB3_9BACI|nr:FxsA family protein [Falsibacillus albus]RLQ97962.1 membrane protein FxsA [Falsibacillus albus]
MKFIMLFLIIVPALEIWLFILSGNLLGVWPTIGLIILTGVIGAYLARQQGIEAIRKLQDQVRQGEPPGNAIIDGVCILVGGVLLLTPGFITDTIGFFLLFPITRGMLKPVLIKMIRKWIEQKNIIIFR